MKNKQAPLAQLAEQLTLNQWVLGSSPRGRTSKKIPLILRNRRDFLRSLNNALSRLEVHIILFAPAGDPSSQSSDTLMSRQRIYAPLRVSVFGVRCGPAGVAVDTRWFSVCAPCLANWGGGGLSRFSVLLGGWCFACGAGEGCRLLVCCLVVECGHAKARRNPKGLQRANHTKSRYYRTGQIRVTNSRKSSTSLPCSSRPTPKRVATSALSSNDK